jgi:hypothetical protein
VGRLLDWATRWSEERKKASWVGRKVKKREEKGKREWARPKEKMREKKNFIQMHLNLNLKFKFK